MKKYTFNDFNTDFPNDDACLEWMFQSRWPNGVHCDKCDQITKHHRITKRPAYACDRCGNHVYPLAGTIMERSSTSLRLWFYGMFLMASTRCGISAKQLERELGVTYKTAWRMFKQIRSMLDESAITTLFGAVEMDETYLGGRRSGKRGRGAEGKTIIAGMVERKGRVVTKKVEDVKADTLTNLAKTHIDPSSILYTDELPSYNRVYREGYVGKRVYHKDKEYARFPGVHTNTIEGFWGLVKGGIRGVYHHVSPQYAESYFNEYAFRYSHRNDETPMFHLFLGRLVTEAHLQDV